MLLFGKSERRNLQMRGEIEVSEKLKALHAAWCVITDCGQEGCGECDVCRYLAFLEEANSVAPAGSVIQRDAELDRYIAEKYP